MSQISKKTRFEIFKRDGFTCAYCGAKPPAVVLQVDHIEPRSKGGDDSEGNLITSCFSCNSGKSNRLLSALPQSLEDRAALIKEKEDQLKGYRDLVKKAKARAVSDVNAVEAAFREVYQDVALTDAFKTNIRITFLTKLDGDTLVSNMELACSKISNDPGRAVKYFCGINWRMISRGAGNES